MQHNVMYVCMCIHDIIEYTCTSCIHIQHYPATYSILHQDEDSVFGSGNDSQMSGEALPSFKWVVRDPKRAPPRLRVSDIFTLSMVNHLGVLVVAAIWVIVLVHFGTHSSPPIEPIHMVWKLHKIRWFGRCCVSVFAVIQCLGRPRQMACAVRWRGADSEKDAEEGGWSDDCGNHH